MRSMRASSQLRSGSGASFTHPVMVKFKVNEVLNPRMEILSADTKRQTPSLDKVSVIESNACIR